MPDKTLKAPLPGIFYRRPSPDEDLYVEEGGRIAAGDVVGLIEVMKTFNELKAEEDGTLERYLVENAEQVKEGQDVVALGE